MTVNATRTVSSISRHLQTILDFSNARPAGSEEEEKTKDYIEKVLSSAGYTIERQGLRFPNIPALFNEQFFDVFLIIIALLLYKIAPLIGFLLPVIFSILPVLMLEVIKLFPRRYTTENLIAIPEKSQLRNSQMLIISHVDTAKTIPYLSGFFGKFIIYCQRYLFYVSFFIAIQSFSAVLNIALPFAFTITLFVVSTVITLTILIQQLCNFFSQKVYYSPGANDNGSGIATALAVAEFIAKDKKKFPACVSFLFTSAEEQGLFGADKFSRINHDWNEKPIVMNIDSIGSGNALGLVKRYGRMAPVYTSKKLNSEIKKNDKNLVDVYHIHRCGDYLPFLRAGYPVSSLEAVLDGGTPNEYHTVRDTQDYLNFDLLDRSYKLVLKTIANIKPFDH
jgi:hypothetical protein